MLDGGSRLSSFQVAWNPTRYYKAGSTQATEIRLGDFETRFSCEWLLLPALSNENRLLTRLHGSQELYVRLSSAGKGYVRGRTRLYIPVCK